MRRRGFTLIEVAAAMAIAGVVAACALSAFAMLNRRLTVVHAATLANDRSKAVVGGLVARLQEIGGASVRPFMAVKVENAPGETGTSYWSVTPTPTNDRLLYATTVPGVPECGVIAAAAGGAGPAGSPVGTERVAVTIDSACCSRLGRLYQRQVMLTNGTAHRQLFVEAVTIDGAPWAPGAPAPVVTPANVCVAETVPGLVSASDTPPATAPAASFAGGRMTVVDPAVVYIKEATSELHLVRDADMDGVVAPHEDVVVSAQSHAFEAQLGFDCNGDGVLTTTSPDEWILDGTDALPAGCDVARLRALEVALIAGAKVNDPNYLSRSRVPPNRTEQRSGVQLRGAVGRAVLRNALAWGL
jgi:prepilin-type N-terminal cleavage/methylation domain-containing protein